MELTYKDRLVIKANTRKNRLMEERMSMPRNSPQWQAKTREIGLEKEFIKNLHEGSATLEDHPGRAANATI